MFLLGVVGVGVFAVQLRNFSMLGGGAALQTSFRAAGVFVVRDQFGSPSVQWESIFRASCRLLPAPPVFRSEACMSIVPVKK